MCFDFLVICEKPHSTDKVALVSHIVIFNKRTVGCCQNSFSIDEM